MALCSNENPAHNTISTTYANRNDYKIITAGIFAYYIRAFRLQQIAI